MTDTIRVVVVDDIPETREHLAKLLSFETDIEVVGVAASGLEAIEIAARLTPDVVLMDINMPGMDGIATTEELGRTVPTASVVMMSVQGEADYLRRSMLAGAREFLVKPFSSDELCGADPGGLLPGAREDRPDGRGPAPVRRARSRSRWSARRVGSSPSSRPRAGSGRTTLAVNLAVAMASDMGRSVALVDASFQFGDVGVLLNLNPATSPSWTCWATAAAATELIDSALISHSTGIRVLLAPPSPEMAELVTTEHIRRVVDRLRMTHDLVIIDSWPLFQDSTLALLDMSDLVLGVLTLEITNIKNIRLFLEVADQLGYGCGQAPPGAQSRRLRVRHPHRGRRELHRPQGRPHRRLRRSDGRLRPQPGRAVHVEQQAGPGQPGHPGHRPGHRRRRRGRSRRPERAPARHAKLFAWR